MGAVKIWEDDNMEYLNDDAVCLLNQSRELLPIWSEYKIRQYRKETYVNENKDNSRERDENDKLSFVRWCYGCCDTALSE